MTRTGPATLGHKRRPSKQTLMAALAARPPKPWEGDSFDTETHQGWARLICTPDDWCLLPRGSWRKAFRFLVDHGPRLSAFNLRFDAEAILKHLPLRYIRHLLAVERLTFDRWDVTLIPWKMLRIADLDTGAVCEMYDVSPFFGSGLQAAAERFLHDSKNAAAEGVDPARLNTDPDAWNDLPPIIRYCQKDAYLTRQLTSVVAERFNTLGGSFDTPYSVAFVTADILMRDSVVPRLDPEMVPLAESAFGGGWFDCFQRGRFEEGTSYDVKSAYPSHMIRLEDSHKGRWIAGRRIHKDALHAILEVDVDLPRDDYPWIAPIRYRASPNSPVTYPVGRFSTVVHKDTYHRFESNLTIRNAWSYIPQGEIIRPYARTLEKLLKFRESTDELLNDAAKRGAASIYGKTRNRHLHRSLIPAGPNDDTLTDGVIATDDGVFRIHTTERRGILYNPHHASLITEGVRLQMWDALEPVAEHAVQVMTDGFILDKPRLGKTVARKPGDLGFVVQGDTVSCGSGEYEIKGHVVRTRGVFTNKPGKNSSLKSWFSALRGVKGETVRVTNVRPAHLSECLSGTSTFLAPDGTDQVLSHKDANVFVTFKRDLNVCFDEKRLWPRIGDAKRLLRERFRSLPLEVYE